MAQRGKRATWAGALALVAGMTAALAPGVAGAASPPRPQERRFDRVASFPVYVNTGDVSEESVAEIVAASVDGRTLVYTDSAQEAVGFVDISVPSHPEAAGLVPLGGEPTSVAVHGPHALVAVDTSGSFTEPSGHLAVLDVRRREAVAEIPLAGQPDAVDVSPDGRFAAVVIENERDEDVVVDDVEGGLPQNPPGLLQIVDLRGAPSGWMVRDVDLTGLSAYGPGDPEPEYVDVNAGNLAVVTLQENNHLVLVDLVTGTVVGDFPAGTVDLTAVDAVEDGVISLTGSLPGVPREPDAVAWLSGNRFVTANEGDLFGGSRGFSVFDTTGRVRYDSGAAFEHLAVRHGHYPEDRSENKGTEPEGVAAARYGSEELVFVGSERGGFVAVYRVRGATEPELVQVLPAGLRPEGITPIPSRGLLVVSSESDDPPYGVRAVISIYSLGAGPASYPQILSADGPEGTPIPWGALSGLAADPTDPDTMYAVSDSFYADARIFTIDVSAAPAVVTGSIPVSGAADLDLEGIAVAPGGGFWLASEGNASGSRPNRLLLVDAAGKVVDEIGLPDEVVACRESSTSRSTLGSGFEGVAVGAGGLVSVVQQRGWDYTTPGCEDLDDDEAGVDAHGQPRATRLWTYDPESGEWGHVPYLLAEVPEHASWVGLSEITALEGGGFAVIERDNLTGDVSEVKSVVRVSASGAKTADVDLLAPLRATNGWISDKPEGFTVAADGETYLVTDNDGVDDWSGETTFLRLGPLGDLFGG